MTMNRCVDILVMLRMLNMTIVRLYHQLNYYYLPDDASHRIVQCQQIVLARHHILPDANSPTDLIFC